jgi:hypothetical protein
MTPTNERRHTRPSTGTRQSACNTPAGWRSQRTRAGVLVLVVGLALFEAVQHAILVTGNTTLHLRHTYRVIHRRPTSSCRRLCPAAGDTAYVRRS